MSTYKLINLGCKVNEYEGQYYISQLEQAGYRQAQADEPADLAIVNSCTVTNAAAAKSRKALRRLRRENPEALLILIGCLSSFIKEDLIKELQIDLVIDTTHKTSLLEKIEALQKERKEQRESSLNSPALSKPQKPPAAPSKTESRAPKEPVRFESMPIYSFHQQHRAFLKVQDGCNQFCAYCQIPLARGRERSASPYEIARIAKDLEAAGHLEIVLTGIHTGRYRYTDETGRLWTLADLLKLLLESTSTEVCFRLSSIEINEVSDALIALMKENRRLLPHLHIPIQAASNTTLARMERPYSVEEFKDKVEKIRAAIPEISISTDVIAGFAAESELDFEESLQNLEDLSFSFLHVFGFSLREGTRAAEMEGQLSSQIIKERVARLLSLSKKLREKDMARFSSGEVLVEKRLDAFHYSGHTPQYHAIELYSAKPIEKRIQAVYKEIDSQRYRGEVHETFKDVSKLD